MCRVWRQFGCLHCQVSAGFFSSGSGCSPCSNRHSSRPGQCHADLQQSVLAELPQLVKAAAFRLKKQAILDRLSGDDVGESPLLGTADYNTIAKLLLKPDDPAAVQAMRVLQQVPDLFEDGSSIKDFVMSFKGIHVRHQCSCMKRSRPCLCSRPGSTDPSHHLVASNNNLTDISMPATHCVYLGLCIHRAMGSLTTAWDICCFSSATIIN